MSRSGERVHHSWVWRTRESYECFRVHSVHVHACVCDCACTCVRVCVRACVCACTHACGIQRLTSGFFLSHSPPFKNYSINSLGVSRNAFLLYDSWLCFSGQAISLMDPEAHQLGYTSSPSPSTGVTGAHHSVLFLWSWGSRLRPSNSLTEPLLQSRKEGMYLRLHWRGGKWGKAMFFILAFVLSFSNTSFLDPGVQVQIGKMVSKESRAPN